MVSLPTAPTAPTGAPHPGGALTREEAEALLARGAGSGHAVVAEPLDPSLEASDMTLGMNGVEGVTAEGSVLRALFSQPPSQHELRRIRQAVGRDIEVMLADPANPEVFRHTFERARALHATPDGFVQRALKVAYDLGASDLRIAVGDPPSVKLSGVVWGRLGEFPPVSEEQALQAASWCAKRDLSTHQGPYDLDASAVFADARLRVALYREIGGWACSLRFLPNQIPQLEALDLPDAINNLANLRRGLVFTTGPTGSGKTTTQAALIDKINRTRNVAIVTLENPVEYRHTPQLATIHHREIGTDTESFSRGLDTALRSIPDVILVGELRNAEEYATAIHLARTGHLVFATLHAESVAEALIGVIHAFPEGEQNLIQTELAATVRAIIVQKLVREKSGNRRGQLVCEIMLNTETMAAIVSRGQILQVPSEIQNQRSMGMQLMDDALAEAVVEGRITEEGGRSEARRVETFDQRLLELR